ncbi:MAG: patatin-like phospholipase family protein [Gemmatimonadetes bacterium]|nr:patatin-like phospholipase family protein [Gemmatimonadota bacterium]
MVTAPLPDGGGPAPYATRGDDLALVLTGGGARAAYQVGFLRCLARRYPDLRIPILVGVSAGAVNIAHLAAHPGTLPEAVADLTDIWVNLEPRNVFRVDSPSLLLNALRWLGRLTLGGAMHGPQVRGLVDTRPLRDLLRRLWAPEGRITGIAENLERGRIKAVAVSATNYSTGQSVVWVQGRDIQPWTRPKRTSERTEIGIEHVMASSALPLFFPAVSIGDCWYGDGGIRLTAPLSPALHLGAGRILAISTRYERSDVEAARPSTTGYPPPAQVFGVLLNAIFLDLIDEDALRLRTLNHLLEDRPQAARAGLRRVELMVLRPSVDLGRLVSEYEARLPRGFRWFTRGLGTRETTSPDILSLVMFQRDYLRRLIEIGEADAEARAAELEAFLAAPVPAR